MVFGSSLHSFTKKRVSKLNPSDKTFWVRACHPKLILPNQKESCVSPIYFESAGISKSRRSNFRGFTVYRPIMAKYTYHPSKHCFSYWPYAVYCITRHVFYRENQLESYLYFRMKYTIDNCLYTYILSAPFKKCLASFAEFL